MWVGEGEAAIDETWEEEELAEEGGTQLPAPPSMGSVLVPAGRSCRPPRTTWMRHR